MFHVGRENRTIAIELESHWFFLRDEALLIAGVISLLARIWLRVRLLCRSIWAW